MFAFLTFECFYERKSGKTTKSKTKIQRKRKSFIRILPIFELKLKNKNRDVSYKFKCYRKVHITMPSKQTVC